MSREMTVDSMEWFCDEPLTQEQKESVVAYLNTLKFSATYELPKFPDSPMDWQCQTIEMMLEMVEEVKAEGGRISWIGPDSTSEEVEAHKAFRGEIRQRGKRWLAAKRLEKS